MPSDPNGQFPPSSPLISNEDYAAEDPFAFKPKFQLQELHHQSKSAIKEYPTPNPSSALFRSSSPVRSNNNHIITTTTTTTNFYDTHTPEPVNQLQHPKKVKFDLTKQSKTVRINSDFNILDPDVKVTRIPLLNSKSHITIGRSSKSCDFAINAKNSFISRIHVSLSYNSQQIILNCLGQNGITINIPKPCFVYATNSSKNYLIMENKSGNPLNLNDLNLVNPILNQNSKSNLKSIKLDSNNTQFFIKKHETITIPRLNNILLEISNQILLINPQDIEEELTEDELPTLITPIKAINHDLSSPPRTVAKKVVDKLGSDDLDSLAQQLEQDLIDQQQDEEEDHKLEQQEEALPQPILSIPNDELTPSKPPTMILLKPKPKSIETFKIFEDKQEVEQVQPPQEPTVPEIIKRQSTPLNDKSNTYSNPTTPKFKRAQSEEPPKQQQQQQHHHQRKKKKQDVSETSLQKVEINQDWISDIDNIDEINNILINHLAFSRLSSTPASFLNTISVVTSKLQLNQLRVLLHNIKCIGVIYREGKDAAGKQLEEEYYYMPENDNDFDRTNLVSNLKGHGGLRSCRRTHKQYYWKKPAPIKK
ncbi:hypothetical protein DFJ63DRAFT_319406 [Scheffersomyces coipomensis]|uniref:uncharacterized protein n=1 Tax=Scheffersomyces coipomensis TaxID=1788519 RepID=UPI00315CF849